MFKFLDNLLFNCNMSKTILVTGCCGFIGSNMCNFLLKKNYNLIKLTIYLQEENKTLIIY